MKKGGRAQVPNAGKLGLKRLEREAGKKHPEQKPAAGKSAGKPGMPGKPGKPSTPNHSRFDARPGANPEKPFKRSTQNAEAARAELGRKADPEKAKFSQKFFRTEKGGYGEGDRFIGITVPDVRRLAREFAAMPIPEILKMIASRVHEERLFALIVLVARYTRGDENEKEGLYRLYMRELPHVNNWDLVDTSAPTFIRHLLDKDKAPIYQLAKSKRMWDRRVAIVGTQGFIRQGKLDDTFKLAEILLHDEEDLMHKAVGWTLREAGKRDEARLKKFLDRFAAEMPRTMLRYAIEHFPESVRRHYLNLRPRT